MGGEDLQGAELGDAVFDVIERELEDVQLALPEGGALGLEVGPVDGREEAAVEVEPGVVAGEGASSGNTFRVSKLSPIRFSSGVQVIAGDHGTQLRIRR